MSIVCLGEALVDLIGEPQGPRPRRFAVHFGGALANVAVAVARAGAPAALAGGCGTDAFGEYLRGRLEREGVDVRHLHRLAGVRTPFAFVRLAAGGEPRFEIFGEGIEAGLAGLAGSEPALLADADGLVIGSNTLVGEAGRAVTLAAVTEAERAGVPVLFDPNLRPGRWRSLETALELCRELAPRCLLLKVNLAEARLLAGDDRLDPAAAAAALSELGPDLSVLTASSGAIHARGIAEAEVPVVPVADPNPIGAGDAFMGTLSAHLHAGGWSAEAVEPAVRAAADAGADACRRVGAID